MAKDLVRTRRYVQKFYQMRTQLQAVGLRIQTLRSNQQMAEAMRGASRVCIPVPRVSLMATDSYAGYGIYESWHEPAADSEDHE